MAAHPRQSRLFIFVALAVASAFMVAMHAVRPWIVSGVSQDWLVFNLVLAWIPFVLSLVVYDRVKAGRRGAATVAIGGTWVLFLPNAPYIVTDLIHLPEWGGQPLWYDATMYIGFAWTGLMLGLVSLYLVHRAVRTAWGATAGWTVAGSAAVLTGVGIYLGRFLRWNSWDIVTQPTAVVGDLARIVVNPLGTPAAITAIFAAFFAVMYLAMYAFAELRSDPAL